MSVKAGDGGGGCASISHKLGEKMNVPDGGNGGAGGDAYFVATSRFDFSLASRHLKAENGKNGQGGRRHGRKGESLRIEVPVGTIIKQARTVDTNGTKKELTRVMYLLLLA